MSSQSEIEDIPKKTNKIYCIYDDNNKKYDERYQIRDRQADENMLKNPICDVRNDNEYNKGEK